MSIRLMKQKDFCVALALTYFAENYLDLLWRYLRNEDISKVWAIFFSKNKSIYLWQNIFIFFAQMGQAFTKTVLQTSAFEKRLSF